MKFNFSLIISALILTAAANATPMLTDLNFVAPTVKNHSSLSADNAVGLVVHDALTDNFYGLNGAGTWIQFGNSQNVIQVVTVKDVKSSGTDGGTCTAGSWITRNLNTLENPTGYSWVSIGSNQITLTPGSYLIEGSAPANSVLQTTIKLYNVTGVSDAILGTSEYASSTGSAIHSSFRGVVTVSVNTTFEVRHICQATVPNNGLGVSASLSTNEVYTQVGITKIQ